MSKSQTSTQAASALPLYDFDDDYFTPACEAALKEIFHRFDKDGDGALSDAELAAFATATNGEPFDEATLEEIRDNFDVTEAGALTLRGFIELYTLQTTSEPEETWNDLRKHGYNDQLELVSAKEKPQDKSSADA
ncbi:hypothetical protein THASP1DRAFT_16140 [Thamnocephalis sphaerospora]|uniref:EF-hand domain-containing protein n=1 Tax=Thamnocephalis sphaerospora TaxID=78915 RepID=A0A4P9XQA2_9FUNG|nr:hypothetical protein THASP1DRAFT_16140 [Thamnocephalis sphaerospora]|eukprot:RKP08082.1 hypothetical protein THASP1DRAFT_16140 [Thamnocephalis sphaerospora]